MKNFFLGAILIIAVAASGFFFVRAQRAGQLEEGRETAGVCLACEQEVVVKHRFDEGAPFNCSACGEKAVFPWMFCYECNYKFVPDLEMLPGTNEPNFPLQPQCRHCKCYQVTYYDKAFFGDQVAGHAKLPSREAR